MTSADTKSIETGFTSVDEVTEVLKEAIEAITEDQGRHIDRWDLSINPHQKALSQRDKSYQMTVSYPTDQSRSIGSL